MRQLNFEVYDIRRVFTDRITFHTYRFPLLTCDVLDDSTWSNVKALSLPTMIWFLLGSTLRHSWWWWRRSWGNRGRTYVYKSVSNVSNVKAKKDKFQYIFYCINTLTMHTPYTSEVRMHKRVKPGLKLDLFWVETFSCVRRYELFWITCILELCRIFLDLKRKYN